MVACAGLSVAAYALGVQPALAAREADEAYAADLQGRRQNAADLAATLATARQKLEQTRREVAGLPLRLELAAGVNQRLAKLADLATAAGLEINEVQPGAAADAPHYQVVPIRISGTGTYPAAQVPPPVAGQVPRYRCPLRGDRQPQPHPRSHRQYVPVRADLVYRARDPQGDKRAQPTTGVQ